jgi:phosphoglucosamine mutase
MYPQVLKNIRVSDKAAVREHPEVQAAIEKIRAALGDSGRILLRESGTEPVIRVMVEADTAATCERYVDAVIDKIRALGLA